MGFLENINKNLNPTTKQSVKRITENIEGPKKPRQTKNSRILKMNEEPKNDVELMLLKIKQQTLIDEFEQIKLYLRTGKRPSQTLAIETFEKHLQELLPNEQKTETLTE